MVLARTAYPQRVGLTARTPLSLRARSGNRARRIPGTHMKRHDSYSGGLFRAQVQEVSTNSPALHANSSVSVAERERIEGQTAKVLECLRANGRISPATARSMGIMRLAARVGELRAAGFRIKTTRDENREAVYSMDRGAV